MKKLINQYGTKMAHLIKFIRDTCDEDDENRIIVFSHWPRYNQCLHVPTNACSYLLCRMQTLIGNTLESEDIRVVYCQGNVMR